MRPPPIPGSVSAPTIYTTAVDEEDEGEPDARGCVQPMVLGNVLNMFTSYPGKKFEIVGLPGSRRFQSVLFLRTTICGAVG